MSIPVTMGDPTCVDLDNDGFMDFVGTFTKPVWLHNSADTAFQTVYSNLPYSNFNPYDLADFDGDSKIDMLHSGLYDGQRRTYILRANADNLEIASQLFNVQVPDIAQIKWLDFDRDGDLDIFTTGDNYASMPSFTKLYQFKNGVYQPSSSSFDPLNVPHFTLMDMENDGDLDLVMTGYEPAPSYAQKTVFYRNQNNLYVKDPNASIVGTGGCEVLSGDLNNDGFADLVIGGVFNSYAPWWQGEKVVQIYWNNGTGGFSPQQSTKIVMPSQVTSVHNLRIADIDNNGTRDILFSDSTRFLTQVAGTWQLLDKIHLGKGYSMTLADYNHDNKLDFNVLTDDFNNHVSGIEIYSNHFPNISKPPKPPGTPTYEVQNGVIRFQWTAGFDEHTPIASLRYNVRVGTSPGWGDIVACDSDTSGRRLLFSNGNVPSGRSFTLRNLKTGNYWFSVQTIDGHLIGSTFKTIPFTVTLTLAAPQLLSPQLNAQQTPVFTKAEWTNVPDAQQYELQVATDALFQNMVYGNTLSTAYDTLALPDCETKYFWRVRALAPGYLSTWSETFWFTTMEAFSPIWGAELPAGFVAQKVKFVHLDADEWIDLAVLASIEGNLQQFYESVFCFTRDADGAFQLRWQSEVYGQAISSDTEVALMSWLDRDQDGDSDFYLTGLRNQPSRFFRNDGSGKFDATPAFDLTETRGELAWFDADNDNDPDGLLPPIGDCETNIILPDGPNSGTYATLPLDVGNCSKTSIQPFDFNGDGKQDVFVIGSVVWASLSRNFGNLNFDIVQGTNFQWARGGDTEVADIDSDGDMDLIVAGFAQSDWSVWIYENVDGYFSLKQTITDPDWVEVAVSDFDLDGDPDLLLVSWGQAGQVYKNTGGQFIPFFTTSFTGTGADFADVDGDGDSDMACGTANGAVILRNNEGRNFDFPPGVHSPGAPEILSATVDGNDVVLSFQADMNRGLNSPSTAFNLRVGTTPGGSQIVSPLANPVTGKTYLPESGNVGTMKSYRLKNLADRTYYWSVQSIAADLIGSPFAVEQKFTVGAVPTLDPVANDGLRISPNPAAVEISIQWSDQLSATDGEIRITDALGRVVHEQPVVRNESGPQKLQVQHLVANLYFLQVISGGRVVAVGKFVKQ